MSEDNNLECVVTTHGKSMAQRESPPSYFPPSETDDPPAYSTLSGENSAREEEEPVRVFVVQPLTTLDLLESVFEGRLNHEIVFQSPQKIDLSKPTKLQLRDAEDNSVMSPIVLNVGGKFLQTCFYFGCYSQRVYQLRGTDAKFFDNEGRVFLQSHREYSKHSMTVVSGTSLLGVVEGVRNSSSQFVVRNILDEVLFIVKPEGATERKFDWDVEVCDFVLPDNNRTIIAKATRGKNEREEDILRLTFLQDVDRKLKGTVIACANALFIQYYARTSYGVGGLKTASFRKMVRKLVFWLIFIIVMVVLTIIFNKDNIS